MHTVIEGFFWFSEFNSRVKFDKAFSEQMKFLEIGSNTELYFYWYNMWELNQWNIRNSIIHSSNSSNWVMGSRTLACMGWEGKQGQEEGEGKFPTLTTPSARPVFSSIGFSELNVLILQMEQES